MTAPAGARGRTAACPCQGTVRTPGEKSISHRAVLFAALAEGTSVIHGLSDGADVAATLAAVEAMGAAVERAADGSVTIRGGQEPAAPARRRRSTAGTREPPCACWPDWWPGSTGRPS